MKLDYSGDKQLANPSLDQVFEYLARLADETDSFLILERDDRAYIQACAGYYIEFRQAGDDKNYCTVRDDLSLDEAKTIFERYYEGDESFQTVVEFQADPATGKSGCLAALLCFPLLWLIK